MNKDIPDNISPVDQVEELPQTEVASNTPEVPTEESALKEIIKASEAGQEPAHATLERIATFQESPAMAASIYEDSDFLQLQEQMAAQHKEETFGGQDPTVMPLNEFMERVNTKKVYLYDNKKATEAEFRKAHPDKAREYDEQENNRIYTNDQGVPDWRKDPAFAQVIRPTDSDYDRLNINGRLQKLARSNPDKVALYSEQYPELKAVVEKAREWGSQSSGHYNNQFQREVEAREAAARSSQKVETAEEQDPRDLYEAQSEHRFQPPQNEIARQRLDALQNTFTQYSSEHSEVAGLTLFGSMTKGYATEESDIDGYLFVDADKVAAPSQEKSPVTLSRTNEEDTGVSENIYRFDPAIQEAYTKEFRGKVQAATGLSNEKLRNLTVEPISRAIIQTEIKDLLLWAGENVAYQEQIDLLDKDPQGAMKPRPKRPENRMPSSILSSLFHLQVGQGLKDYRHLLIDELSKQGASGEFVWKEIIRGTEMMEQSLKVGTAKQYPRTLAEAQRIYS